MWFCYLNHHFVTAVKVCCKLVSHVCEHMNYWKRVFSNCFNVPNLNIKSLLILVEWKIIKHKIICVCYLDHHFITAVKVCWKLVSHVCKYMSYWKRVFPHCFDVLNLNFKSLLLLVEWKINKHKIIFDFLTWTNILSLL